MSSMFVSFKGLGALTTGSRWVCLSLSPVQAWDAPQEADFHHLGFITQRGTTLTTCWRPPKLQPAQDLARSTIILLVPDSPQL